MAECGNDVWELAENRMSFPRWIETFKTDKKIWDVITENGKSTSSLVITTRMDT